MRQHGILSMATWVVGFEEERDRDYWRGLRQLLAYDPDQIQMLYVTPHRWTPYFRIAARPPRDPARPAPLGLQAPGAGDALVPPWRVILWVKLTEAILQGRPKAFWRTFLQRDRGLRHAMHWYSRMGKRVWPYEIKNFLFRDRRTEHGPDGDGILGRAAGRGGGGAAAVGDSEDGQARCC